MPCSREPALTASILLTQRRTHRLQRFDTLTYDEMLARNLKVMDAAAIALARDNAIPVIVFSIRSEGEFNKVLQGNGTFTRVTVR
jgi:uridylate kinase